MGAGCWPRRYLNPARALRLRFAASRGSAGLRRGVASRAITSREYFYYVDLHGRLYLDGATGQSSGHCRCCIAFCHLVRCTDLTMLQQMVRAGDQCITWPRV